MAEPVSLSTIQFLSWVANRPRSFAEVREAWRSTCPRLSTWEDALSDRLVRCEQSPGKSADDCAVTLTGRGRSLLEAHLRTEENRQLRTEENRQRSAAD